MIYALIAIIGMGFVIAVLAIIAIVTLQRNDHLEREKKAAMYELESAIAGKEALKAENADLSEALEATRRIYNTLLAEHRELEARSTALQQALEAKPTQARRTVRKDGAQAPGQEGA